MHYWTGFSARLRDLLELKLLTQWGRLKPGEYNITYTQVSTEPRDYIHAISVPHPVVFESDVA
jgi:hypothetical protein